MSLSTDFYSVFVIQAELFFKWSKIALDPFICASVNKSEQNVSKLFHSCSIKICMHVSVKLSK